MLDRLIMPWEIRVIISYILLSGVIVGPTPGWAGLFGPKNYEECILDNMKGITSNQAARLINKACREKFPPTPNPFAQFDKETKGFDEIFGLERRNLNTEELQNLSIERNEYDEYNKTQGFTIHNGNSNVTVKEISIDISSNSGVKTYSENVNIEPHSVTSFHIKILKADSSGKSWSISKAFGLAPKRSGEKYVSEEEVFGKAPKDGGNPFDQFDENPRDSKQRP